MRESRRKEKEITEVMDEEVFTENDDGFTEIHQGALIGVRFAP